MTDLSEERQSNRHGPAGDPPPIGHNNPPTEYSLADTIAALPARLEADHAKTIADKIKDIADRANAMPVDFATDDDLATATDIVNDAADTWDEFDGQRKTEKDPFKRGAEIVDDFYRDPLARLKRIKDAFTDRATKYNREKKRKADAAAQVERDRLARIEEENRIAAQAAAAFGDDEEAETRTQIAETVAARIEEVQPEKNEAVRGAGGGSVGGRKEWSFEIEDFEKVDLNALRGFLAPEAIEKALKQLAKSQKHLAKVTGVRFFEDEKASFKRR